MSKDKSIQKKIQASELDKIVQVTWKFVTQNNPLILCTPEEYDDHLHRRVYGHWNEDLPKPLMYSRPVLYQSYHGHVARKGAVGNLKRKSK